MLCCFDILVRAKGGGGHLLPARDQQENSGELLLIGQGGGDIRVLRSLCKRRGYQGVEIIVQES